MIHRTPAWKATRERVLDSARDRVVEHGWDRFSVRGLARDVGLSPASLYEYFEGKEAILEAVAERARGRLVDELRAIRPGAEGGLVELAMAYVGFARRQPEDFLLLYGRGGTQGPGKGSPYAIWLQRVARELGDGADVPRHAYGLWACAHGLAMLQVTALAGVDADFESGDRATLGALVSAMRTPRVL